MQIYHFRAFVETYASVVWMGGTSLMESAPDPKHRRRAESYSSTTDDFSGSYDVLARKFRSFFHEGVQLALRRWSVYGLYAYNAVREQNWVTLYVVYSTSRAESLPSFLPSFQTWNHQENGSRRRRRRRRRRGNIACLSPFGHFIKNGDGREKTSSVRNRITRL